MKHFLLVISLLLLFSCTENDNSEEYNKKPTVKIGILLPLSGDVAFAGNSAREAMLMEFEKIQNSKNLKYKYELLFEDVGLSAKTSAIVANKFINADKVNAIISMWSIAGNVVAPIAEKNKIPSFTSSYGEQSTRGKYNFNLNPLFDEVAYIMSNQLIKNNIKKVALFVKNIGGNLELRDALIKSFDKNEIEITHNELFHSETKDFRMAINKSLSHNPEIYIIIGTVPTPYIFVKQLREVVGEEVNVTSVDAFSEMPPQQAQIANGKWLIDTGTFGTDEFVNELKAKKNVQAYSNSGSMAANLVIVLDAFENAISNTDRVPNSEEILDWIWNNVKDYDTPVGKVTVVNDGLIKNDSVVKTIVEGRAVTIN